MDITELLNQQQLPQSKPSYFDRLSMNPFFQTGIGILSNNSGNYGAFAPALGRGMQTGMQNINTMKQNQFDNQDAAMKRMLYGQQVQSQIENMKAKQNEDKAAENQAKFYFKSAGLDFDNLDKEVGGFLPVGSSGQDVQSSPIPNSLPPMKSAPLGMDQTYSIAGSDISYAPPKKPSKLESALDKWGWSPEEKGMLAEMAQIDPKGAASMLKNEMIARRKAAITGKAQGRDELAKESAIASAMGMDVGTYLKAKFEKSGPQQINVSYGAPIAATDAQGNPVFIRPPKDANSAPVVMQGYTPPEKPTEAEAKSATFHQQMDSASNEIKNIEKSFDVSKYSSQLGVGMAGGITNPLASKNAQRYRQAQEQWAEAFLRIKTGAAATQGEVDRNISTFFPQFGDDATTIDQKRRMRDKAEQDVKSMAGTAMRRIERGQGGGSGANDPLGIRK